MDGGGSVVATFQVLTLYILCSWRLKKITHKKRELQNLVK